MNKKLNIKKMLIGAVIVVITSVINLLPYYFIGNSPFWLIGLIMSNLFLYYCLCSLVFIPIGTMMSAVVGNITTGFATFVITGFVFMLSGDYINLICSFMGVVTCVFLYYNKKLPKPVGILLSSIAMTVVLEIACYVNNGIAVSSGAVETAVCVFGVSVITFALSLLLEKLPFLKNFDEKESALDQNYRVHSLNRKLMIVINIICAALIIIFAILTTILLVKKENTRKYEEENIWEVVLYNAIQDKADIFPDKNMEEIEGLSSDIEEAFRVGKVEVPAWVIVTTNIKGEYVQQCYKVIMSDDGPEHPYTVTYLGEMLLDPNTVGGGTALLPEEGNSMLTVSEKNRAREEAFDAVGRMVSVALILMVFINLLADFFIRKNIVKPINQMTTEAMNFAFRDEEEESDENYIENIERTEINSGDEIESLSRAIHKTMDDVDAYLKEVKEKSEQLSAMQHNIIITMADIIESRDLNTGGHIRRTAIYVGIIAKRLRKEGYFKGLLNKDYMNDMIVAAPLHDMGKIHVPDQILNKNGRLTDEEFAIMKTHAAVGKELLDGASDSLGEFRYLIVAKQMAECHHEWWNGNGYPNKLAGEDIPLCARIMAVADVFDALVSKRCYKDPMDLDVAFEIIEKETGTHFDPVVGKIFLECRPEVEKALKELTEEED